MSTDMPVPLVNQAVRNLAGVRSDSTEWIETAITVLFTTVAVLFVSFVAVVTGLV